MDRKLTIDTTALSRGIDQVDISMLVVVLATLGDDPGR